MLPEGLEIVSVSVQGYFSTEGNPGGGSFLGYREAASFGGQGFSDIDGWVIFSDDFPVRRVCLSLCDPQNWEFRSSHDGKLLILPARI